MLVVTDPTQRGIVAAERIADIARSLDINIENTYLILNRVVDGIPAPILERTSQMNIPLLGSVPANRELAELEYSGQPLIQLGNNSPVYQAVAGMMAKILA